MTVGKFYNLFQAPGIVLNPLNSLYASDYSALHFDIAKKNVGKFYNLHFLYKLFVSNDLFVFQTLSAKKRQDFLQFGGVYTAVHRRIYTAMSRELEEIILYRSIY